MSTYIIIFLCVVIVIMAAITAQALNKVSELEDMWSSLNNRYEREIRGTQAKNKEIQALWAETEQLRNENKKLQQKEISSIEHRSVLRNDINNLKKQLENNVPRETTYNKSYGIPEVVDYYNTLYPTGEDK